MSHPSGNILSITCNTLSLTKRHPSSNILSITCDSQPDRAHLLNIWQEKRSHPSSAAASSASPATPSASPGSFFEQLAGENHPSGNILSITCNTLSLTRLFFFGRRKSPQRQHPQHHLDTYITIHTLHYITLH